MESKGQPRTRVCERDGRRIVVAQTAADWRHREEGDGAEGGDEARPEVGGPFAGRPAEVADGAGPEARCCRHFGGVVVVLVSVPRVG